MATRRNRSWFFTTSGDSQIGGFWRRLVGGGISKPTQATFEDLLESCAVHNEITSAAQADSAAALGTKQGLVIISTDANAKAGNNTSDGGSGTIVVKPSQLPTVEALANSTSEDMPTTVMDIAADGATTTRNKFQVRPSVSWITWLLSRLFKSGGSAGQVPVKLDNTNYNWGWATLTLAQTSGTLPVSRGGTGAITANDALNALLPSQVGNAGKVISTDGTNTSWVAPVSSSLPVGMIMDYISDTPPDANWMVADGSAISRTTYSALFAVIGTTYGSGNGTTTFNIPNFQGKFSVGKDSGQTEFRALAVGAGSKTITLSKANIPPHVHTVTNFVYSPYGGTSILFTLGINGGGNIDFYTNTYNTGNGSADSLAGTPFTNLPPYLVINKMIKVL